MAHRFVSSIVFCLLWLLSAPLLAAQKPTEPHKNPDVIALLKVANTPMPALAPIMANGQPLRIVATFSVLADMIQVIGGNLVSVTSLVKRDFDPHIYDPKPKDVVQLKSAQLIVINGLGLEGWLERLITTSGYKGPRITATHYVKPMLEPAEKCCTRSPVCSHKSVNPHAWNSIPNALKYIQALTEALSQALPAHKAAILARSKAYVSQLEALHKDALAKFSRLDKRKRKVITAHDAFGYLGEDYGIEFLAPMGLSTETEASAKSIAEIITRIRKENIKALFKESLASPKQIEMIARDTKLTIAETLYADALSAKPEPAGTFLKMMQHNLHHLHKALCALK
jgi:zinc/manganese transport system substrate-binding protein